MRRSRVLVVEDDAGVADAVVVALERDGLAARGVGTVEDARAGAVDIDLAILDLGLPDGSGYTLLAEWRDRPGAPSVIVLTGRDDEVDCVAALEAGADDFVSKPFSPRALLARARAVLRRRTGCRLPAATALLLDLERRTVSYAGRSAALTRTEFDLLAVLAGAPGRVFTRGQLVSRVWGAGTALTERTVDSHIKALRRKLEASGAETDLIASVRGVGFKLAEAS